MCDRSVLMLFRLRGSRRGRRIGAKADKEVPSCGLAEPVEAKTPKNTPAIRSSPPDHAGLPFFLLGVERNLSRKTQIQYLNGA